jgi:hypothetical protein
VAVDDRKLPVTTSNEAQSLPSSSHLWRSPTPIRNLSAMFSAEPIDEAKGRPLGGKAEG